VLAIALLSIAPVGFAGPPHPSTFSIVAVDPETGEAGVAVASRFFAVGTVVPFAKAGVGAIATQSFANTSYGPRGLELLEKGLSASEVVSVLTRADNDRAKRQLGVVTASGDSATFTGPECNAWAGGRSGPGYAVQGNVLTGEDVVAAMEKSFVESKGKPLAETQPAVLAEVVYDLAVIRLAAGDRDGAKKALERALKLNPKLEQQAKVDKDLEKLR
jgi:uncharacterized Ntn-hydrolase superfamily protein